MKIRNGFVSNSSSSSFICKGYTISELDEEKLVNILISKYPDCINETNKDYDTEDLFTEYLYYLYDKNILVEKTEDAWIIAEILSKSSDTDYLCYNTFDCTTINQDVKDIVSNFTDELKFKIITYTRET